MEHPHKQSSAEEQLATWFGRQFFNKPDIKEDNNLDSYTLEKFYRGQSYLMKDILFCLDDFPIFTDLTDLKLCVHVNRNEDLTRIIFDAGASHWVLIYIKKEEMKRRVFYKDPEGNGMKSDVKEAIETELKRGKGEEPVITFHEHDVNDLSGNEVKNKNVSDYTGAITIRNVPKMDVSSVEAFESIKFTTVEDLVVEKLQRASFLAHEVIKGDGSFIHELKKIRGCLPLDLVDNEKNFRKDVKGKVEDRKTCMSPADYQSKRDEYLNESRMRQIQQQYEGKSNDQTGDDIKVDDRKDGNIMAGLDRYKAKLDDFKKLMYLMSLCDKQTQPDDTGRRCFDTVKELLKDLFDMDFDKLLSALETIEDNKDETEEDDESLAETHTPGLPEESKSLEEFFDELGVLNANEHPETDANLLKEKAAEMKQLYNSVMTEHGNKQTQFTTTQDIQDWAKQQKRENAAWDDSTLIENLAMVITGLKLVKGYGIRIPHLFTLLYALKDSQQGKIFQVQTGEGKTNIVALLAILKVLQGKKVDVVTSNIILAKDGVHDTRDLYSTFCVTVDHNDPNDFGGKIRNCYKKDVVYGSITTFQFDYLRDRAEGFQYRCNRPFHELILDEVDNMLIDNGGYIAKLAEPFPGMESLRYMYIHIWIALGKVEGKYEEQMKAELEKKFGNIDKNKDVDDEKAKQYQTEYEDFLKALSSRHLDDLKTLIKEALPRDVINKVIPSWIQRYVDDNLDKWIENAIYAKYECHEDVHYVLDRVVPQNANPKDQEDIDVKEPEVDRKELAINGNKMKKNVQRGRKWKVIPLDYENTGIAMTNTIWSDGLHQFVQLKHNLYLTFENLTSSYISNIGYINLFKKPAGNITGLTGTIGSKAEQELLDVIYKVDFVRMPTFKQKLLITKSFPSVIEEDQFWCQTVLQQTVKELLKERAVLIICETVQDAKSLEEYFYRLLVFGFNLTLKKYYNEDHAKQKTEDKTYKTILPGYVILATNLAGRGTDFKTSGTLNTAGGLHVIVGFLPCNQRVEDQAFGRTARTGKNGSATIVMKESQAKLLNPQDYKDFEKVKRARDLAERRRLNDIRETTVVEIKFKDELFQVYADHHLRMKGKQFARGEEGFFQMKDFKEQWAFWLKKEDLSCEKIKGKQPAGVFDAFVGEYRDREIQNPYYKIVLADEYITSNNLGEAQAILEKVLTVHEKDKHLLAAVHFKLFDLVVQNAKTLEGSAKKALEKVFGSRLDPNAAYKAKSKGHLDKAMELIKVEIEFLSVQFLGQQGVLDAKQEPEVDQQLLADMEKHVQAATKTESNPLLNHLHARRNYLSNLYLASQGVLDEMDKKFINKSVDFFMENRGGCETFAENKQYGIYFEELAEFATVGLSSLYTISEVNQLSEPKTKAIQIMLGCGIALIPVAVFFPVIIPLVVTLISEAVCDIIFAIIEGPKLQTDSEGEPKRDMSEGPYIRDKLITIGLSLFLIIGSASSVVASAVQKAINACKAIEKFLEKIPVLKKVIQRLIDLVKKVRGFLQRALDKMLTVGPKLTAVQTLKAIATGVGKNVFKNVSGLILEKLAKAASETLKSIIEKSISNIIGDNEEFMHALKKSTILREDLEKVIKEFGETKDQALSAAFNSLSTVAAQCGGNAVISLGITAVNSFKGAAQIATITEQLKSYLLDNIKNPGADREDYLDVKELIAEKAAERIMELLGAIGKNWQRLAKKFKNFSATVNGKGFDVTKEKVTKELKEKVPKLADDLASAVVNNMWDSYIESNENLRNNMVEFNKALEESPPILAEMREIEKDENNNK